MSPTSLVQGYTISGLPPVITVGSELPGALFEVEVLVGPPGGLQAYINKQLTIEQLADYIGALIPGTGSPAVSLTLAAAKALINASGVKSGVAYTITSSDWNANTPSGAINATVYVHGLNATEFAPYGSTLDANDVLQPVRVNVAAGTYDTEELRGLWLVQYGEIDPNTLEVPVWFGPAATPSATARVVVAP